MKSTYEEYTAISGDKFLLRIEDGACIPCDPANSDYQRYLNPEAEQSTPNLAE